MFTGCLWPLDPGCLGDTWAAYPTTVKQRATQLASSTLSRLTAGRVGDCPVTVRPESQNGPCGLVGFPSYGYGSPLKTDPRELELPPPVYDVLQVVVDGVILPTTDYRLFDSTLRYVGATRSGWPTGQDWNVGPGQPGYFAITYKNTAPVDAEGQIAAGLLAVEFAKVCGGGAAAAKCRLPSNVTSIVRSGVSIEVVGGAFPEGLTSIREVDNYVAKWNRVARSAATLIDPGAPRFRVEQGVSPTGVDDGTLDGGTP